MPFSRDSPTVRPEQADAILSFSCVPNSSSNGHDGATTYGRGYWGQVERPSSVVDVNGQVSVHSMWNSASSPRLVGMIRSNPSSVSAGTGTYTPEISTFVTTQGFFRPPVEG